MPQQAQIALVPNEQSGLAQIAGAQPLARNVTMDRVGAVTKRPGIAQFGALTDAVYDGPITGLHVDARGNVWAAATDTAGAWIYNVTPAGAVTQAGFMLGDRRVQFAETQAMIVAASGDRPYRSRLDIPLLEALPGNPPQATHVVAQGGRLVVMGTVPDTNQFNYSAIASGAITTGHEQWNGAGVENGESGPFQASARPDYNRAMHDTANELFVWGDSTLQVFAPDSTTIYAGVATRELGALAPYSIVKDDQAFYWFDNYKRFVTSDGRTYSVVSDQVKRQLESISDPKDGFGFRVLTGPTDSLVWSFPQDQRSFVYHKMGAWSQWASWSQATQNWTALPVTSAAQDSGNGRTIVGLSDGRLGVMTHEADTDLGDQFTAYVETGFEARGTYNRKHCQGIALTLRRGWDRAIAAVPKLLIQWRDDEGDWSTPLMPDLGALPDREIVVRFYSLGVYRRRQWRFSFLSGDPLVLVRVDETFEVMEN